MMKREGRVRAERFSDVGRVPVFNYPARLGFPAPDPTRDN